MVAILIFLVPGRNVHFPVKESEILSTLNLTAGPCSLYSLHLFTEYYLEDCIQLLNFVPPPNDRKKKRDRDDEDETGDQEVNKEPSLF